MLERALDQKWTCGRLGSRLDAERNESKIVTAERAGRRAFENRRFTVRADRDSPAADV